MIYSDISNTDAVTLSGYQDKAVAQAVNVPLGLKNVLNIETQFSCCNCFEVFGGGSEAYQNDKFSFLYKLITSLDTITLKLEKDNVKVATLNDNTLGTYYPLGTWTAQTGQELYEGFVIDWDTVLSTHGVGCYVVKAEKNILGVPTVEESKCFTLRTYNDSLANNSVSFQWLQNGLIKSGEFDYTDMNWTQYIRVKGQFGSWDPKLEKDSVLYSNYFQKQVQDEIVNTYTFNGEFMDNYVTKLLILDMMLADEIYVSDFNLYNHRDDYVNFQVRQDEIPSMEELQRNTNAVISLQFTDRYKNTIK